MSGRLKAPPPGRPPDRGATPLELWHELRSAPGITTQLARRIVGAFGGRYKAAGVLVFVLAAGGGSIVFLPTLLARKMDGPAVPGVHLIDRAIASAHAPFDHDGVVRAILALDSRRRADVPITREAHLRARNANQQGLNACRRYAYDEAIETFAQGHRWEPDDPEILNNLGYAQLRAGQYALAQQTLRETLALTPRRRYAWINLGQTLADLDNSEDASACFRISVAVSLDTERARADLVTTAKNPSTTTAERAAIAQALSSLPP